MEELKLESAFAVAEIDGNRLEGDTTLFCLLLL